MGTAAATQQTGPAASNEPAGTSPQVKQVLPSYEGQNVSSVEIAGQPDVTFSQLEPLLQQKSGEPFSQQKIDASIAAIKREAHYQDVQLQVVPDVEGVRVLLVLQPGMYFGMYDFPGAESRFTYTRLLQVSTYPPEGPYSREDVSRAADALTKFYQRSGYFLAQVKPELQIDKPHGIVNVSFRTVLGKKAKFGKVSIVGTTPEETTRLEHAVKGIMARIRSSAVREGKGYSPVTLRNATQYLEGFLAKQKYLGAQVKLVGAAYDPATNKADISYHVVTGQKIAVKVEGVHLWSWTRRKMLPIYQEVGVDPELIQEGRQNLVSYMQNKGYFDAVVKSEVTQQANGTESILYQITKGPRHRVEKVEVTGNKNIGNDELLPQLVVHKEHFLNHGDFSDKLVRKSVKNLEDVYRTAGFSSVKVTPQVTNNGGDINVVFRVDEGQRDIVESLKIVGNDTQPDSELSAKGLKVVPGQPYSQKLIDEDRDAITAHYLEAGYLTATFRSTARAIGNDKHRLEVTYAIHEGPRVITTSVMTLGRKHTKQAFINRTAKLSAGKPLTEGEMLAAAGRLYEPGIFDWSEVDPRRQITTQDREDVLVKVHEAKRNSLTYGFGFEVINRGGSVPGGTVAVPGLPPIGLNKGFKTSERTFWGPRGSLEYTRKNLLGSAQTMTIGGLAGRLDQRVSFSYQDPQFRGSSWSSNLLLSGEHNSQNPIFSSRQAEGSFQAQKVLDHKHQQTISFEYNLRETRLTRLLIADLVPVRDQHVRLSTLSTTYTRDSRDNSLDAHHGIYESVQLGLTPEALGSNVSFSRFMGQTAYYKQLPKKIIWANSVRLGFEKPFNGSHVPLSEEFFSGGGSTLRGFPLNGAGPQRTISACGSTGCFPITVPVGGNQLFIVNSEFRIPVPLKEGLGVAAFYDGGNVFRSIGFHGQYTNTIGAGLRYATPVGPVRIDIGHNLNAPPGIKSTQIFVTLGQAF